MARDHLRIPEITVIAAAIGTIQDEALRVAIAEGIKKVLEAHTPHGRTWNSDTTTKDPWVYNWANWPTLCRVPNSN